MAQAKASKRGGTPAELMAPVPFRIHKVVRETHDTFSLELRPVDGKHDFQYLPGQFNMLYIFGVGEVPISISGDPYRTDALVHTTRAVGNVTKAMKRLKIGETIGIRGPFGTHWPIERAEGNDVVLVAGGIGLAPLKPVVHHILANRDKYGKVVLLYGTRTPNDILFRKELKQWRSRLDMETHITVDRAMGSWHGNVGVVTTLIGKAPFDRTACTAMVCGPEIMMRYTVLAMQKRGVSEDDMYLSMERNMKCGLGFCGHCQMGSYFICRDGPVFPYSDLAGIFTKREL